MATDWLNLIPPPIGLDPRPLYPRAVPDREEAELMLHYPWCGINYTETGVCTNGCLAMPTQDVCKCGHADEAHKHYSTTATWCSLCRNGQCGEYRKGEDRSRGQHDQYRHTDGTPCDAGQNETGLTYVGDYPNDRETTICLVHYEEIVAALDDNRDLLAERDRLAADLAAERERVRRVEALALTNREGPAMLAALAGEGTADRGLCGTCLEPITATDQARRHDGEWMHVGCIGECDCPECAGEGAADQPRPFHSLLTTTDRNAAGTLHLCTASCGWGWRSLTEDEARGKWSDAHTHGEGTR